MKKLTLILAAVCLGALAASAQVPTQTAQSVGPLPQYLATTLGTNMVIPPIIDVSKQQNVSVAFSFHNSAADTSNVVYTVRKSVDGILYDPVNTWIVTIAGRGTSTNTYVTNWSVGGLQSLQIYSISNTTSGSTWTNDGVVYGTKISSP